VCDAGSVIAFARVTLLPPPADLSARPPVRLAQFFSHARTDLPHTRWGNAQAASDFSQCQTIRPQARDLPVPTGQGTGELEP
jgi:hypothetical protein